MENSWSSSPKIPFHSVSNIEDDEEGKDDVYSESSGWTDILAGYSDYVRRLEAEEEESAGAREGFKSYGSNHGRSDSMVSDAGSGPEWKQMTTDHNYNPGNNYACKISFSNNNNSLVGGGAGGDDGDGISSSPPAGNYNNNNTLRKLKFRSRRMNKAEILPYDESLEDTASSPVNSPKITMGLKRMDLNTKRGAPDQENNNSATSSQIGKGEEEYGNYLGNDQMKTASAVEKLYYQTNSTARKKMISSYNAENCATSTKDNQHELQKMGLCLVPVSMLPSNIINYYPMG